MMDVNLERRKVLSEGAAGILLGVFLIRADIHNFRHVSDTPLMPPC